MPHIIKLSVRQQIQSFKKTIKAIKGVRALYVLARKGDGDPGIKNIWRGYRAVHNYVDALEIAKIAF